MSTSRSSMLENSGTCGNASWSVVYDFVTGRGFYGWVWCYEVCAGERVVRTGYRTDRKDAIRTARRYARQLEEATDAD